MGTLVAIGRNLYDLLVDDGSIAVGIVAEVVLTELCAAGGRALRNFGGPLLFLLLMGLLLVNLYLTGQRVRQRQRKA